MLRRRPAQSAAKYAKIWTPEGSPLAVHTARQARLLREATGLAVEYAMRYGEPTVASALRNLPGKVRVVPLYPQYARSTTESVRDVIAGDVEFGEQFHDHPAYIAALAALVTELPDVLVMSFHGLPQRAVDRGDPYRDQCLETARLVGDALRREVDVAFQSRFGRAKWLEPATDATLAAYPKSGVTRVAVAAPGFAADCLETLEELAIRGRQQFAGAGGGNFAYLPCLNADAPGMTMIETLVRRELAGWLA